MKRFLGIFIVITTIIVVLIIGAALWINSPETASLPTNTFMVSQGETLEIVANRLEQSSHIRSALFFRILAKIRGVESLIQKGNYLIPTMVSSSQILDMLVSGKQHLVRLTIPDGYTISKIAKTIDSTGICSGEAFEKACHDQKLMEKLGVPFTNAQGFLYPDTYFFAAAYPPELVVEHLVKRFFQEVQNIYPAWKSMSTVSLGEKVILASIIEREYVATDEAPLMASVFSNRLNMGKGLESCATVVYIITEIEGKPHPDRLFYRDLDKNSLYNTYRYRGLPPGPISNPGSIALKAAFFPASSDFLYFVLKDPAERKHHFSRTFAEHSQAAQYYLKQ